MSEILFLAHRIPFPPDRGDKIRSHHVLKRLAQLGPVHVATFADVDSDIAEEADLSAVAESYKLVKRTKPLAFAGVQALVLNSPVSLTAFHSAALANYVAGVLASRPISVIYVFSGQMGQYVPRGYNGRIVADFVDVDSAKFEAYATKKAGFRSWIDAREGRKLRAAEAQLARRADVSLLISDAEAALFRERLPEPLRSQADVQTLANGIDSAIFDPVGVKPEPAMLGCPGPRIIFTGQMDYAPNIEAVVRAMDAILPLVRARLPDTTFHVVGRNPPEGLLNRHGEDGNYIWGRVPDMQTWLKAADCALVPLDIGRGVQNKVLEAMSMALPVVLTPEAATGIGARHGRDFFVERDDVGLANALVCLLQEPTKVRNMAEAARSFIIDNASWEAALAALPDVMCGTGRTLRDAA